MDLTDHQQWIIKEWALRTPYVQQVRPRPDSDIDLARLGLAPCHSRSSLGGTPLAREHKQSPRTYDKFHGKIEKQHGARNAIDDQADDSPDGKRVGEEHCPDHSYVLPAWSDEGSYQTKGDHAEVETRKCP